MQYPLLISLCRLTEAKCGAGNRKGVSRAGTVTARLNSSPEFPLEASGRERDKSCQIRERGCGGRSGITLGDMGEGEHQFLDAVNTKGVERLEQGMWVALLNSALCLTGKPDSSDQSQQANLFGMLTGHAVPSWPPEGSAPP